MTGTWRAPGGRLGKNYRVAGCSLARKDTLNLQASDAEEWFVPPKTRLDAVVRIREKDEDTARIQLSEDQRRQLAAVAALEEARTRARHDARTSGRAQDWDLADRAHQRALLDARIAEHAVSAADEKVGTSRANYVAAYSKAEAMRRVVETRRADIIREAEKAEAKRLDEMATLLFARE
jgi:flagellar export protein FliJ